MSSSPDLKWWSQPLSTEAKAVLGVYGLGKGSLNVACWEELKDGWMIATTAADSESDHSGRWAILCPCGLAGMLDFADKVTESGQPVVINIQPAETILPRLQLLECGWSEKEADLKTYCGLRSLEHHDRFLTEAVDARNEELKRLPHTVSTKLYFVNHFLPTEFAFAPGEGSDEPRLACTPEDAGRIAKESGTRAFSVEEMN